MKIIDKEEICGHLKAGIANDILTAKYHYFIFRTIGENYSELSKVEQNALSKSLGFIQEAAQNSAVLSLARAFDPPHRLHRVLSIPTILKECENCESKYFPIQLIVDYLPNDCQPYPYIKQLIQHVDYQNDITCYE